MLKRFMAQLLHCPPWPPAPPPARKAMAKPVAFERGDRVQRRSHADGRPPAYRFRGTVCGEYDNPATGEHGYNVSLAHDPGCIQNFPGYMLEPWSGDDD